MSYETKIEGYITPTEAEISARKRRNNAIGLGLALFCILVFGLMIVKLKTLGATL